MKRLRNQGMRGHNLRASAFSRVNRNSIFLRIQRLLRFHRLPQFFAGPREWNRTYPSHEFPFNSIGLTQVVVTRYTQPGEVANNAKRLAVRKAIAAQCW